MKLCIPIHSANGLDSEISDHFGRAPYHLIVASDTQSFQLLHKDDSCSHGHCLPVQILQSHGVHAVLCKGMGRGAYAKLASSGIAVWIAQQRTVSEAIAAFQRGTLRGFDEAQLCRSHSHE